MRISDWSSDVCSSDLLAPAPAHDILGLGDMVLKRLEQTGGVGGIQPDELLDEMAEQQAALAADRMNAHHRMLGFIDGRDRKSRRVGKECVSTCRFRWAPYH